MSDALPSSRRALDPIAAGAALGWAVLAAVYMTAPLQALLVRVVPDDATFYLVIARNGAAGRPSSFDGFTRTNGYHPLWLAVLQALALPLRSSAALARAGLAVGLLAYAAAGVTLWRALARWGRAAQGVVVAGLALFVLPASWLLTEAPLALALYARFVATLLEEGADEEARDHPWTLALWGTLTILARLDAVFLVVPPLLSRAWDRLRGRVGTPAGAAAPLLVSGAAVALYMAANAAAFGHPMPISGMIKGSFPHVMVPRFGAFSRYARALPPLAGAAAWLIARALGWKPPLHRSADRALVAALLGLVGYYAYEILFQKEVAWGVASWHFALATLLLATVLALGGARASTAAARGLALTLLVLAALDAGRKLRPGSPVDSSLAPLAEAGAWLRDHTEPSAVVAATDPGLIAWLGERRTIALDGLVNTLAYQSVLRDRRLAAYLRERGVGYVAVLGPYAPDADGVLRVPVPSRLYAPAGDTLDLGRDAPVFTARGGGVRIWRYPPRSPAAM